MKKITITLLGLAIILSMTTSVFAGAGMLLDIEVLDDGTMRLLDVNKIHNAVPNAIPSDPSQYPDYYMQVFGINGELFWGFPGLDVMGRKWSPALANPKDHKVLESLPFWDPRMRYVKIFRHYTAADPQEVGMLDLTPYMSLRGACGDGTCSSGEHEVNCPADCPTARRDAKCTYNHADNLCDPDCLWESLVRKVKVEALDDDCGFALETCPMLESGKDAVQCLSPPTPPGVEAGSYAYIARCKQGFNYVTQTLGPVATYVEELCPGYGCVSQGGETDMCVYYPDRIYGDCRNDWECDAFFSERTEPNYRGVGYNIEAQLAGTESPGVHGKCECGRCVSISFQETTGVEDDETGAACCNQITEGWPPIHIDTSPTPTVFPTPTPTPPPTSTVVPTCFVGGTKISMADGSQKNIEDVKVGDMVLTYDFESRKTTGGRVSNTYIHESNGYIMVNNLKVTKDHPFIVNGEWTYAGDIKVGDSMFMSDGSEAPVQSIKKVRGHVLVYNFEVEQYKNYIVDGIVGHNARSSGSGTAIGTIALPKATTVGGSAMQTGAYKGIVE